MFTIQVIIIQGKLLLIIVKIDYTVFALSGIRDGEHQSEIHKSLEKIINNITSIIPKYQRQENEKI